MIRSLRLLPLLLLTACGDGGEAASEPVEIDFLVAWTAETEDGLRVAAETLQDEPMSGLTGWSEERLLRRQLQLDGEDLLRIHLIGQGGELAGSGELLGADGSRYVGLGEPPSGLSDQARSLWLVLGDSEALPGEGHGRRSFLLHGSASAASDLEGQVLVWTRGDRRLELQRRSWTGKQRQQFLDPAPPSVAKPPTVSAPPAGDAPNLPPGHPPVPSPEENSDG